MKSKVNNTKSYIRAKDHTITYDYNESLEKMENEGYLDDIKNSLIYFVSKVEASLKEEKEISFDDDSGYF